MALRSSTQDLAGRPWWPGMSMLIPVRSRSREDTLYRSKRRVQHRFTGFNSAGVLQ